VAIRRGLLEHCEQHRMPPLRFAAFVHLIMNADPSTGIVWSSAQALAVRYDYEPRTARLCLETLEQQGYIKRFATKGKHGQYPILISKYVCSVGCHEGKMVNASATTDYASPVYETCQDFCQVNVQVNSSYPYREREREEEPRPPKTAKPKQPPKAIQGSLLTTDLQTAEDEWDALIRYARNWGADPKPRIISDGAGGSTWLDPPALPGLVRAAFERITTYAQICRFAAGNDPKANLRWTRKDFIEEYVKLARQKK
jgi:hypothetical protein